MNGSSHGDGPTEGGSTDWLPPQIQEELGNMKGRRSRGSFWRPRQATAAHSTQQLVTEISPTHAPSVEGGLLPLKTMALIQPSSTWMCPFAVGRDWAGGESACCGLTKRPVHKACNRCLISHPVVFTARGGVTIWAT